MDANKTTIVRLVDLTKDLKFIIGSDEADLKELEDHTLKYLGVVNRQIRRLNAAAAKAAKVIGKPTK